MKLVSIFFIVVSLSMMSKSCSDENKNELMNFDDFISNQLGDTIIQLITSSDTVSAFTLNPDAGIDTTDALNNLQMYRIKERLGNLEDIGRNKIKSIIASDSTYNHDTETMSMCFFTPEIGFKFINEKEEVDIIYSSHCHEIRFYHEKELKIIECDSKSKNITVFCNQIINHYQ